ncbi:MAG: helix-hairpin-helix domain-containing protein [Phycisphaerae bacterium]|nr:helix-hairpin-helix domain-containing protein [Phycisphaerae bacterium]NUQ46447.1 helix-hairpin-helix domain-containing protein [Phycisphaerae bacterium]
MFPESNPAGKPRQHLASPADVAILLAALATASLVALYTRPHAIDAAFQQDVISESAAAGLIEIDGSPGNGAASPAPPLVAFGVDPETAPWWELAALPRLGESIARRIVEFRESRRGLPGPNGGRETGRVFGRAEDLLQVPGIGRATLRQMRPFLRFPDDQSR